MSHQIDVEQVLLQDLVENSPDYIFIKDKQSRFVFTNKAHSKILLGLENPEDAFGKTDFDLFPGKKDDALIYADNSSKTNKESHDVCGPFEYSLTEKNICVLERAEYKINENEWQKETDILKIDHETRKYFKLPRRSCEMLQPWFNKKYFAEKLRKSHGKLALKFSFDIEVMPVTEINLCMESPEDFTVNLNGKKIAFPKESEFWIDLCFKTVSLPASLFNKGKNIIYIETLFRENIDLEAIYLVGNFGVKIDKSKCVGCGACAKLCPYGAIKIENDGKAHIDQNKCKGCGKCKKICPFDAIIETN